MASASSNRGTSVQTGTMVREMEISTPLDPDVVLFHRMKVREELGRLSRFHVDLLSREEIGLNDLLGRPVSIKLALTNDRAREFNGYVTRFSRQGTHGRYKRYRATVSPWLWFLTRTSDCRTFLDMTIRQIVDKVFSEHDAEHRWKLVGDYSPIPYCVQYRETDFNFVSRLLEREGIYYYFDYAEERQTMVLTDSYAGHDVFPGYAQLQFAGGRANPGGLEEVSTWTVSRQVQPGAYAQNDYDPERPHSNLSTRATALHGHQRDGYERFDYPGGYAQVRDGERYASVRIEEFSSRFETISAASNAKGLAVGRLLKLAGHPSAEQNREYLVTAATYQLEFSDYEGFPDQRDPQYRCRFAALSTEHQFRPRRHTPRPSINGVQTAFVVGPVGEEIETDALGRIRIQFHWDRYGLSDEHSSCWVRVSQFWAGHHFGALFLPRGGQEVIVDFVDGDPDRPIVVGRVYNGSHKPPYELPAHKTQSGIKTRSTPDGAPTECNEIRFEDRAGHEELFMQAQRTMKIRVKASESHRVGGSRSVAVGGSQSTTINQDHTVKVVEGAYDIHVPKARFHVMGKHIWQTATEHFYASVAQSHVELKSESISINTIGKITADVCGNAICIDPASVSINAMARLTLTCGTSKIELKPEGIEISSPCPIDIKGLPIKLNS